MKLHAILLVLYAVSGYSANLMARQETCPEDNCWRAVWGTALDRRAIRRVIEDCQGHLTTRVVTSTYSLTTITILAQTTATEVVPCSPTLPSSITSSASSSTSSLPGFLWPTAVPAEIVPKVEARQNTPSLSYSVTTIIGPIPTSAILQCSTTATVDLYASACMCEGITSSSVDSNGLSMISTGTATSTLTSTVTSTAVCSSSTVITLSYSSSTSVTILTFTSSAGTGTGTGTGIGTVPPSSTSSSSATSFNITTTPSSTLSSTTTSLNTTLTSSTIPTPTCTTPGYVLCNNTCLNATSDAQNCGSCGNRCSDGLVCFNGVCARRPVDPPCDTNCTYRRECNRGIGGASCSCARDSNGYGICFNANDYQCLTTTPKCKATADCRLGAFCIKSICSEGPSMCSNTTEAQVDGICVTNSGCGAQGPVSFGALVRFHEPQQRKRIAGEFNW